MEDLIYKNDVLAKITQERNLAIEKLQELGYGLYEQIWYSIAEDGYPARSDWYSCTIKDGEITRVTWLYWDVKKFLWLDNRRKNMFELYDIYGKETHEKITEDQESVDWTDLVVAWKKKPRAWEKTFKPTKVINPIEYSDCANAMLKMWIDNVITDGEYNKIMDKLNAFEMRRRAEEDG